MREQEIIEALRRREEAGMDALLLHYRPLLQYIIAPILQNPQDREDCLSEVSLRIWEKIEQFDPQRGSWSAWLTACMCPPSSWTHRRPLSLRSSAAMTATV